MTDDTWDETSIASGFVYWYTEPRAYGSYTPLMEEKATRIFFDWLRKVKADAIREAAIKAQESFVAEQGGIGYARVRTSWLLDEADRIDRGEDD